MRAILHLIRHSKITCGPVTAYGVPALVIAIAIFIVIIVHYRP